MFKLNEEQKKAVETLDGYVRVIAGAGSGKTKALTERYVWLVEGGVLHKIFCALHLLIKLQPR